MQSVISADMSVLATAWSTPCAVPFVCIAANADAPGAKKVAKHILHALERPLQLDDHTIDLAAGIGIASCPAHSTDADELLSRAEIADRCLCEHTLDCHVASMDVGCTSIPRAGQLDPRRWRRGGSGSPFVCRLERRRPALEGRPSLRGGGRI